MLRREQGIHALEKKESPHVDSYEGNQSLSSATFRK